MAAPYMRIVAVRRRPSGLCALVRWVCTWEPACTFIEADDAVAQARIAALVSEYRASEDAISHIVKAAAARSTQSNAALAFRRSPPTGGIVANLVPYSSSEPVEPFLGNRGGERVGSIGIGIGSTPASRELEGDMKDPRTRVMLVRRSKQFSCASFERVRRHPKTGAWEVLVMWNDTVEDEAAFHPSDAYANRAFSRKRAELASAVPEFQAAVSRVVPPSLDTPRCLDPSVVVPFTRLALVTPSPLTPERNRNARGTARDADGPPDDSAFPLTEPTEPTSPLDADQWPVATTPVRSTRPRSFALGDRAPALSKRSVPYRTRLSCTSGGGLDAYGVSCASPNSAASARSPSPLAGVKRCASSPLSLTRNHALALQMKQRI